MVPSEVIGGEASVCVTTRYNAHAQYRTGCAIPSTQRWLHVHQRPTDVEVEQKWILFVE